MSRNRKMNLPVVETSPCYCPICCDEGWGDFKEDQCLLNKRIKRISDWYKETKEITDWYKTTMEQLQETEEGRKFMENIKKEKEEKENMARLELECRKIDPTTSKDVPTSNNSKSN